MHPMPCPEHSRERGVTLIEMVIVIAITAIIAGAVSVFISRPVEGYADAARRAEMSDIADTALRRMTRDLRTALANSIRITCVPSCGPADSVYYLEYLQGGGGTGTTELWIRSPYRQPAAVTRCSRATLRLAASPMRTPAPPSGRALSR